MTYATRTGEWAGGRFRGRIVVTIDDLPQITRDTSAIDVTAHWWAEFTAPTWDASNSFDPAGAFDEPARAVPIGTASSPVRSARIYSKTIRVPLQYGAQTRLLIEGRLSGVENVGATMAIAQDAWLPARPYQLPTAAQDVKSVADGATQARVSWTPTYTGDGGGRPWMNQGVDRTEDGWRTFVLASGWFGWQPTSWVDTGLQPNRKYEYRHIATNPSGGSPHAYAAQPVYTRPAAPSALSATKLASGAIRMTATNAAPHAYRWEFQDSPDGKTWSSLTQVNEGHIYDLQNPDLTVTHRFRARVQTPDGQWSEWSPTSNLVRLQAAPNPPQWEPIGEAFDATAAIETPYLHNPVDTTPQTAREFQWRASADDGGSWTAWTSTGREATDVQTRVWEPGTFPQNRLIERQVRTWGAHVDASPWSPTGTFRTSSRPFGGIIYPTAGQTLHGKQVVVELAYQDPDGTPQSASRITLHEVTPAGDRRLGSWLLSGPAVPFVVPYELRETTYRISASVRDGAGVWSDTSTVEVPVVYLPPMLPSVTATWDDRRGSVTLEIINPAAEGDVPDAVYNNIYRDGRLIATGLPLSTAFTDKLPLPSGSMYTVEAVSALPSSGSTVLRVEPSEEVARRFWLNSGSDWEVVASFWANVKRGQTRGRNRITERYSGREHETETIGEGKVSKLRVTGTLILAEDSPADLWEVIETPTPICYRDRYGAWFVSVEPIPADADNDALSTVSVTMTEVDYVDPIVGGL